MGTSKLKARLEAAACAAEEALLSLERDCRSAGARARWRSSEGGSRRYAEWRARKLRSLQEEILEIVTAEAEMFGKIAAAIVHSLCVVENYPFLQFCKTTYRKRKFYLQKSPSITTHLSIIIVNARLSCYTNLRLMTSFSSKNNFGQCENGVSSCHSVRSGVQLRSVKIMFGSPGGIRIKEESSSTRVRTTSTMFLSMQNSDDDDHPTSCTRFCTCKPSER